MTLHPLMAAALRPFSPPLSALRQPRFPVTYCSQCGGEFGPGDSGYSHCRDHMEEVTCASCSGSGEGRWDGSTCHACKGSGSQMYPVDAAGPDEEDEEEFEGAPV